MVVLAIENLISSVQTLDELIKVLKTTYKLKIKEFEVANRRLIHINRTSASKCDVIPDECSNIIIDESMDIISRNIGKLYPIKDNCCLLDICEDEPVIVEEWLPGKQIILSKFYNTYLLSTKEDIHGNDYAVPGGPKCSEIIMHALNSNKYLNGIDTLFSENFPDTTCWCFQIVPKNEFNLSTPTDYEVVLLNAINTETQVDMSITQLNNIAEHYHIPIPKRKHAYGIKQIKEVSNILYRQNPTILGTIVVEVKQKNLYDLEIQRGKYNLRTTNSLWEVELTKMANTVLKHKSYVFNATNNTAQKNMVKLMRAGYSTALKELSKLYIKQEYVRTNKIFANNIKSHPMAAALFALRYKKISGLFQMHQVIKAKHLLKYIEQKDNIIFKATLDNYREELCQINLK